MRADRLAAPAAGALPRAGLPVEPHEIGFELHERVAVQLHRVSGRIVRIVQAFALLRGEPHVVEQILRPVEAGRQIEVPVRREHVQ